MSESTTFESTYVVSIVFKRLDLDSDRIYVQQSAYGYGCEIQVDSSEEARGMAVHLFHGSYAPGEFAILATDVYFIGRKR